MTDAGFVPSYDLVNSGLSDTLLYRQPQAPLCAARSLILLTVISDELNLISHRTQPQAAHGRMRILLIKAWNILVRLSEELSSMGYV